MRAGGKLLGVGAAWVEMTERLRAEHSLRESEDRLSVLTRSLPDYLWGCRSRGGVLGDFTCTPVIERLTGYTAEAFTSPGPDGGAPTLWLDMVHPEDRERYRALVQGLGPQAEAALEHRIVCADDRVRWVRSHLAASAPDAQGELLLAVGTTLAVYPAAGMVPIAKRNGARVAIVNAEATDMDSIADAVLRGPIAELLPPICGLAENPTS